MDFPCTHNVFGDVAFDSTPMELSDPGLTAMEYETLFEEIDTFDPSSFIEAPGVAYNANLDLFPDIDANDVQIFEEIQQSLANSIPELGLVGSWPAGDTLPDLSVDEFPGWDQLLADSDSPETFSSSYSSTASPHSTSESDSTHHPHRCTADGCAKTFRKESQLKQHQRVHRKALTCPICRHERQAEHKFAQVRDLERHLQARHRDVAAKSNVRSEIRQCPFAGCSHQGRRDNVSRHHESRHGQKLKWKRGSPHVVS